MRGVSVEKERFIFMSIAYQM